MQAPVRPLRVVVEELNQDYSRLRSWQAVGDLHGVTKILAWRIALHGHEPKRNDIRRRLGLAMLVEEPQLRDGSGRYVSRR